LAGTGELSTVAVGHIAAVPGGGTAQVHNARNERVQRLRAAVTLGQRAIQAAVWHAVDYKRPGSTLR